MHRLYQSTLIFILLRTEYIFSYWKRTICIPQFSLREKKKNCSYYTFLNWFFRIIVLVVFFKGDSNLHLHLLILLRKMQVRKKVEKVFKFWRIRFLVLSCTFLINSLLFIQVCWANGEHNIFEEYRVKDSPLYNKRMWKVSIWLGWILGVCHQTWHKFWKSLGRDVQDGPRERP